MPGHPGRRAWTPFAGTARHARDRPRPARPRVGRDPRWPERRPPTAARVGAGAGGAGCLAHLSRIDVHSAVASPALRTAVSNAARPDRLPPGRAHSPVPHTTRCAGVALASLAAEPDSRGAACGQGPHAATRGIVAAARVPVARTSSGEADFSGPARAGRGRAGTGRLRGTGASGHRPEKALAPSAPSGPAATCSSTAPLGSHTAALAAPYADAETTGQLYLDAEQVAGHLIDCVRHVTQAGFHAIGDLRSGPRRRWTGPRGRRGGAGPTARRPAPRRARRDARRPTR